MLFLVFIFAIDSVFCYKLTNLNIDKDGSVIIKEKRDLSFSYSATDIGSDNGSHIKTLTVIKNVGDSKHDHQTYTKITDDKQQHKIDFKIPEIPSDIFSNLNYFHSSKKHNHDKTKKSKPEEKIPDKSPSPQPPPPSTSSSVETVAPTNEPSSPSITQTNDVEVKLNQESDSKKGDDVKKITENGSHIIEVNNSGGDVESVPVSKIIVQRGKIPYDVELIKSDPIKPYQAKLSAKAQSDRLVETTKSRLAAEQLRIEKENKSQPQLPIYNVKHVSEKTPDTVKKSDNIKVLYSSHHPAAAPAPYIAPVLRKSKF